MATEPQDGAVEESSDAVMRDYNPMRVKRIIGICIVIGAIMLVMAFSMAIIPYGAVIAFVQPLLLLAFAGLFQLYLDKWQGRPVQNRKLFWMRAWLPAVVMYAFSLLTMWFSDYGRILSWIIGEKRNTTKVYGYEGLPGIWAPLLLWIVIAVGLWCYLNLFNGIRRPENWLVSKKSWIMWVVCILCAALPNFAMMGLTVINQA